MTSWLHQFFSGLSYSVNIYHPQELGILFFLGILTELGVPLFFALELFVLLSSFYLGPLSVPVLLIILMLLLGRESGATILYSISRMLGEPFLKWLQRRFKRLPARIEWVKVRSQEHTTLMVILIRLTPGLLQIPSLVAGSLRLSFSSFVLGVAASGLIYDLSLVLFGYVARVAFNNISGDLKDYFIVAFGILIVLIWVGVFIWMRKRSGDRKISG